MLELKEGTFAVIVKGEFSNVNVGKVVYLHKHLGKFENCYRGEYDDAWHVVCPDGLLTYNGESYEDGVIEAERLIVINSKFIGSVE